MQKQNLGKDSSSQTGSVSQIYDEFCPILLNQFKSRDYTKFETFDASLDEFYSKIESQRSEQQQKAKENSAAQKLNKIRQDQENRVHTLRKEADHCVKMAELIEYNLEDVDAAILAVHVALAKGSYDSGHHPFHLLFGPCLSATGKVYCNHKGTFCLGSS
nr:nuclear export mediator factor NEMF-like [Arachis hypogaea]